MASTTQSSKTQKRKQLKLQANQIHSLTFTDQGTRRIHASNSHLQANLKTIDAVLAQDSDALRKNYPSQTSKIDLIGHIEPRSNPTF